MSEKRSLNLRYPQDIATRNIERIFNSDTHNRMAGVVLPTGTGKSFVAMQQILATQGKNSNEQLPTGVINDAKIVYIAPTDAIHFQIQKHIVREIVFAGIDNRDDRIKLLSPKDIEQMVKEAFPNLVFKCYDGIKEDNKEIKEADLVIIDEAHRTGAKKWGPNLSSCLRRSSAKVLAITATPQRNDKNGRSMMADISMMIYGKDDIALPEEYIAEELYLADACRDGVVNVPEIISGDYLLAESEEYQTVLQLIIDKKNELAVDEDNLEKKAQLRRLEAILEKMNEIIGDEPKEEAEQKLLAENIKNINGKFIAFLPPREGSANITNAEHFKSYMDHIRQQFQGVKDEDGNPVKVTFYFVSSDDKLGVDENGLPFMIDPKDNEKSRERKLDNKQMIKDFEDQSSESGGIKVLLNVSMLTEGLHVEGIDGALMYSKTDSDIKYLQQIGRCVSSADPNKPFDDQKQTQVFDFVGNGYRQIKRNVGQRISHSYNLQRLEMIQDWIKEHSDEMPNINRVIDPNASDEIKINTENEIRNAMILKRIQKMYIKYKHGTMLPIEGKKEIERILEIADEMNLWELQIGTRTEQPKEEVLSNNSFLKLSEKQDRMIQLCQQADTTAKRVEDSDRIQKIMNIIRVLKMHKKDLELPQEFLIVTNKEKTESIKSRDEISLSLGDFLTANFSDSEIQQIAVELQDPNFVDALNPKTVFHYGDEETYDFGTELAYLRGLIWTSEYDRKEIRNDQNSIFDNISFEELMDLGIINDAQKDIENLLILNYHYTQRINNAISIKYNDIKDTILDSFGRLQPDILREIFYRGLPIGLLEHFERFSLINGREYDDDGYDRDGYDRDGYNVDGYNRFGFNKYNLHEITKTEYDERGFYYKRGENGEEGRWINRYSNDEYDLLGYNVYGYDRNGYNRPKIKIMGKNSIRQVEFTMQEQHSRNADGTYDVHGYVKGYKKDRRTKKLKRNFEDVYKNDGLDEYGYNRYGFKAVKLDNQRVIYVNRDTSCEYDKYGRIYRSLNGNSKGSKTRKKSNKRINESFRIELAEPISRTQWIMKKIFEEEKLPEISDVCREFRREFRINGDERNIIDKQVKKAFEIYMSSSPYSLKIWDTYCEKLFKQEPGVEEKMKRFFELCPSAKSIFIQRLERKNEIVGISEKERAEREIEDVAMRRVLGEFGEDGK